MIVGIEHLKVLEEFAKRQTRVYPDACDYGYVWGDKEELSRLRNATVGLMELFEFESKRWGGPNTEGGKSVKLFIPFEQDGPEYAGVSVWIATCHDTFRKVIFTKIEIAPARQKEPGFKQK